MTQHWTIKGDKSLIPTIKNGLLTIGYSEIIQSYLWACKEPTTIHNINEFVDVARLTACDGETPNYIDYIEVATKFFGEFFENGGTIKLW